MISPGVYLLKASCCLLIFYTLYLALFKRTTFFTVNRFYLLAGIALSFVIPLFTIPQNHVTGTLLETDFLSGSFEISRHAYGDPEIPGYQTTNIRYFLIVQVAYNIGLAFMVARLLHSMYRIYIIKAHAKRLENTGDDFRIYETRLSRPFTFFQSIFLPAYKIDPYVVEHEKVHARQWHTVDILVVEIITTLLWFNPFVYWYKRAIQEQHEYLADTYTIRTGANIEQYLTLMLHQLRQENYGAAISQFYSISIKNRIIMITKKRTAPFFSGAYLVLVPVCAALLFAFANRDSKASAEAPSGVVESIIIVDPGHGGSDAGAHNGLGLTEKALTLALAKHIQAAAVKNGIKVILTRSADETLALQERTALSGKVPAKLFISLHINNNHEDASMNGIDCIISENNARAKESKEFANVLLNQFQNIPGIVVNGIKTSDFFVLKNNTLPAIALELGFLSNPSDHAFISKEENQIKLAEKIVASAKRYLN